MITVPPWMLTWRAPSAPSDPVPVRMTAIRDSPKVAAAVDRRRSIDGRGPAPFPSLTLTSWSLIVTWKFDGTTKTVAGRSGS